MEYGFRACFRHVTHIRRLYFLTYEKFDLEFFSDDLLVLIKIKRKLNPLVHYRSYLHRTLNFFSLFIFSHSSPVIILTFRVIANLVSFLQDHFE